MLKSWSPENKGLKTIIVSPTRELAMQIHSVFRAFGIEAKSLCVYGGHSIKSELSSLDTQPELLVGTPGRILDHLDRDSLNVGDIQSLIFDEFDKTLEMGFHDEVKAILNFTNAPQHLYSSATELDKFPDFIKLNDPISINYIKENLKVDHFSHVYEEEEKIEALIEILCAHPEGKTIVFCNHREVTERVVEQLKENGVMAVGFHGAMEQDDRNRAIIQFRNSSYTILVSTDLAARGLDIPAVETVIHYQIPDKEDQFIHRNGRTGRMDASGRVVTLTSSYGHSFDFLPKDAAQFKVPKDFRLPPKPKFKTLYMSGGKKDKINKIDIVGFLAKKGGLEGKRDWFDSSHGSE